MSSSQSAVRSRQAAFGIEFSSLDGEELIKVMSGRPIGRGEGPRMVLTANLDHIVQVTRNAAFKAAYSRAWVVTADGMPVYAYAVATGVPLPARVTGADLFRGLMQSLDASCHRCFLIASSHETARRIADHLAGRGFSPDAIDIEVPPFGFDNDDDFSRHLVARIGRHRTTHLFLGIGAPKSELWTDRHREGLGDCYVLHVGAGLDFFAGTRSRAPRWVQASGFEWLWRWGQEPRRLFRRYFVDSWAFLAAVRSDLAERRR